VIAVASKKSHELEESVKQKANEGKEEARSSSSVQKLKSLYRVLSAALSAPKDSGGDSSDSWKAEVAKISTSLVATP
jgi:hypothetical protein